MGDKIISRKAKKLKLFIYLQDCLVDCLPWSGFSIEVKVRVGVELVGVRGRLRGSVTFQVLGTVCIKAGAGGSEVQLRLEKQAGLLNHVTQRRERCERKLKR